MPQDLKIHREGQRREVRLVLLEHDERLLMMREGRGYVAALPLPLCEHRHKRMENAAACGLKAAKAYAAAHPEGIEG